MPPFRPRRPHTVVRDTSHRPNLVWRRGGVKAAGERDTRTAREPPGVGRHRRRWDLVQITRHRALPSKAGCRASWMAWVEDSSQTGFLFSFLGPLPRAALPNTGAPGPTVPQWWREDQAVCDKGKVSVARTTASRPPRWRGRVDGRVPACSRPVSLSATFLWP